MNTLGTLFRVSLFGESHGPAIGVVIDGVPAGVAVTMDDLDADLSRRRAGSAGTTPRKESDEPEIVSGIHDGHTTGSPVCIMFRNTDTRNADYSLFSAMPRPGHADYVARIKYGGHADMRGSGHFSGRITAGLVAAGAIAKKMLGPSVAFTTVIAEAGGQPVYPASAPLPGTRAPAPSVETAPATATVSDLAANAAGQGDSIGAIVALSVDGLSAGLGEPFFGAADALIARALFAVPGVRGVEFGDGFSAAGMTGSRHNDPFDGPDGHTARNGAGGINGGITNGNRLIVRVAVKPASSISLPQKTWNFDTGTMDTLTVPGRHDACIAIRAAVVLEAALACVLADLQLQASACSSIKAVR